MTGQLSYLIALERSRDLARKAERHRAAAAVAKSPVPKNRVARVQRLGSGWLHRRPRTA